MSVTQTATPGGVTVVTQTRVKAGKEDEFARWQNPPYAWVDVPDGSVLHRHDNPTGEGVACWAGMKIICFVEGTGA